MFNIFDIAWYKCNFKSYGKSIIQKLHEGKKVHSKDEFENIYGRIIIKKCQFEGAYNDIISDAYKSNIKSDDNFLFFMSEDNTLWIKSTGSGHGSKWYVCGLMIAYVLSQVCKQECYKNIKRLGMIYATGYIDLLNISDISDITFFNVCKETIGYLPVADKKLWRESQGTNIEKLNILYNYWRDRLPVEIVPPTINNEIEQIEFSSSIISLSDDVKKELDIYRKSEFAFKQDDFGAPHIQYISDIHLDYPGKLIAESFDKQLGKICRKLAQSAKSNVIMISGDTCGSIELAQKFYHKLRLCFLYLEKDRNKRYIVSAKSEEDARNFCSEMEKDIRLELENAEKRVEAARRYFGLKRSAEWLLENGSFESREKYYIVINEYRKWKSIKRRLDSFIENKEDLFQSLQCEERLSKKLLHEIYVVLGNHELSEFDTVSDAVFAYKEMLSKEHIHLLFNEAIAKNDYCIYGGTGFAKYNLKHNADNLIGAKNMDRKAEIEESDRFYTGYLSALKEAKRRRVPLVVVSHYPLKDWMPNNEYSSNAYYFWGHNHRNYSHQKDGINVLANNQIGYEGTNLVFKDGYIGTIRNPFIDYGDGCYYVSLSSYTQFMSFTGNSVSGTSLLERALSKPETYLYMIKAAGFYGFFILTKGLEAKICYGGKYTNIAGTKGKNIEFFFQYFVVMAKLQLGAFGDYYNKLQGISKEIKKLGFDGNIHGCIIDIDGFNHIMVNPIDGKLTFYYSPSFGLVKAYDSLDNLLEESINNSIDGIRYLSARNEYERLKKVNTSLVTNAHVNLNGKNLQKVPRNSGAYAISNRMKRIQCFVESGVLNTWNMDIINDFISDVDMLSDYN